VIVQTRLVPINPTSLPLTVVDLLAQDLDIAGTYSGIRTYSFLKTKLYKGGKLDQWLKNRRFYK
jgi:hypothetical protein